MWRKSPFFRKKKAFYSEKAFTIIRGGASEKKSHWKYLCLLMLPSFRGFSLARS